MINSIIENKMDQNLIGEFQKSAVDTGSTAVQVIFLTDRINQLTGHMRLNKKDNSTKRGLMKLVSQRKQLLRYLKRTSLLQYKNILDRLSLRK